VQHAKAVAANPGDLPRKPVRVLLLGCFDVMHSGHYNALRQAKMLGDVLVAGVHAGESILLNKGPPVMTDEERMKAAAACKWVDEVVGMVPYECNCRLLDRLSCDFCVHGDDLPRNLDGNMYEEVISANRCRIIKRTEGVSSTNLLGRMIALSKEHHKKQASSFLPTSRRLAAFTSERAAAQVDARIVYIDGAFDLFHVGHIETLLNARRLGDFLLVGIHDDETVNAQKGANHPIMSLHERVLSVLSCRFVDDVIIGAPWKVTNDMITSLNISVVASGSFQKALRSIDAATPDDPYAACKNLGMFQIVNESRRLTTETFIARVLENLERYSKKSDDRGTKELEYLARKTFVAEF
jgi:ethanolamine-phosphate cytidylyltransferase